MFDIQLSPAETSSVVRGLQAVPEQVVRASASALKSAGYHIQQDLKRAGKQIQPKLNPHTGVLAQTRDKWGRKRGVGYRGRYKGKIRWSHVGRSGGAVGSGGQKGHVISRTSLRLNPFSRFVNMIRYAVDADDGIVEIGILNPRPQYYSWFRKNVEGFTTAVTPRFRKMAFAIGFPLRRGTSTLRTPARPWIGPVRDKWVAMGPKFLADKFWSSWAERQK